MIEFLMVQTLDGRDVYINPAAIISVAQARDEDDPEKWLIDKVHCVSRMAKPSRWPRLVPKACGSELKPP